MHDSGNLLASALHMIRQMLFRQMHLWHLHLRSRCFSMRKLLKLHRILSVEAAFRITACLPAAVGSQGSGAATSTGPGLSPGAGSSISSVPSTAVIGHMDELQLDVTFCPVKQVALCQELRCSMTQLAKRSSA